MARHRRDASLSSIDVQLQLAEESDKAYFEELNELSYRALVVEHFGHWDAECQRKRFEAKWAERGYQKIMVSGAVVGGLWVQELDTFHQLREIQIHPDHRGRGIGVRVITDEIRRALDRNKELRLRVLVNNRAFGLYKRLGFVETARDDTHHYLVYRIPVRRA